MDEIEHISEAEDFVEKLNNFENEFLSELRANSARDKNNVPILRKNAAALFKTLVALKKPMRILEAGTAEGYSSILAAFTLKECGIENFKIETVEIDEDTANIARNNIKNAGFENNIRVITGDSVEVFSCLSGKYDFIFVDSSKSHYFEMYDDIKRLLSNGGLLVCDDVLFYGKILETPELAPHKHRTIVAALRNFIDRLTQDKDFITAVMKTGDGMTVSVKR